MKNNKTTSNTNSPFVAKPGRKKQQNNSQEISKSTVEKNKRNTIWYAFTVFFLLMALGSFSKSAITGILMVIAATLVCPITKKYFDRLWVKIIGEEKSLKIKKWMYGIAAGVLLVIGCYTFPTSNTYKSTAAENKVEAESQYTDQQTLEQESKNSVVTSEEEPKSTTESLEYVVNDSAAKTNIIKPTPINAEPTKVPNVTPEKVELMEVHFINVGQGDSTLIKCGDHAMLIDAGDNSKGTTVQLYLKKQGVSELDYLVLTHPDADHIGGADVIVTKFDIDNVFMSAFTKTNKTYNELIDALNYKSLAWSTPSVGGKYTLGSAEFTILAPNKTYSDPNNSSLGLIIKNGENSFLFTGDAEEDAESDILANKISIDADVYQVGHHGSKTASSKALLKAVNPTYAVISCGEDNSYGHPHAETLNNLRTMGVKVFRTDEQGSIIATSDGKDITWNCSPSETWKAGESTSNSSASTKTTTSTTTSTSKAADNSTIPQETVQEVAELAPVQQTTTEDVSKIDTNGNGKVTIAEAKAAGYSMPIHSDHWLYKYMDDRDGDGMVGE